MSKKLENAEDRVCGVFLVLLVVVVGVCLVVVSYPLLLTLCLRSTRASCQVYQLSTVQGINNCSKSWTSCQSSCSSPEPVCHQIYVQYWLTDNATAVVPLFANVLGCGYDLGFTCPEFYERFCILDEIFFCEIYSKGYAIPDGQNSRLELMEYFVISLIPLLVLTICCVYMKKRNLIARGYKKAKKLVKKKSNEPRSFYQKKILELEFKKTLRQLKMKNTQNDVKVFDLEHAQTTGALILKPSFSNFMAQPPKIII